MDREKTKKVHFKIIEAEENRDNTKSTNGNCRFDLADDDTIRMEGNDLIVRFVYKDFPKTGKENSQDAINKRNIDTIAKTAGAFTPYLEQKVSNKSDRRIIDKHVNDYTVRNTYDYFIHKDLGGFLRRELDFYIKNEIMRIDDIDKEESVQRVESYLDVVRVVKRVGDKIISFLSHLEEFQKKLWLKKKFVVESGYCVTLDRVSKELWDEIAANKEQEQEWVRLGFMEKGKKLGKKWLEENPYAVIDTKFYSDEFTEKLLSSFDNLEEAADGLIINSENFQALNLLQERYREKVKCIYIDPPYNTSASEIIYKNGYKDSSWLTLLLNRINMSLINLNKKGIICVTVDDYEFSNLGSILDKYLNKANKLGVVVIVHNPGGRHDDKFIATERFL
jgi:adenine-specific DNA-methyltransferase